MTKPDRDGLRPLAWQILAYLHEHPEAQDTLEGIVEWWLLEQRIQSTMAVVKTALTELVDQGWIIARQGGDQRIHYRMNPLEEQAIRTWLAAKSARRHRPARTRTKTRT